MNTEIIKFKTLDGTYLDGFLKYNEIKSKKVIIAIHGMASNCFKKREKVLADYAIEKNIDTFVFNTRGSDIVRFLKREKILYPGDNIGGSAYENIYESYYDIKSAIMQMLELGYEEIYLCGHSLGSTKLVYTYNKLFSENDEILKNIKAVVLLSLVDLEKSFKTFAGNKYQDYINYALIKKEQKQFLDMMPQSVFLYPMSVKSYLIYNQNNDEINFARYSDNNYNFKELNSIKVPLFMRWGTDNEYIEQKPMELVEFLKNKINNKKLDVNIIQQADHSYRGKEDALAEQIINFLENI
ncbi:MAG: hypothetical protein J6J60_04555 [Clostridia bacterium]|nr:hypothetical protein [Clostridia bacterium]